MNDPRRKLKIKFSKENRYQIFGATLNHLKISGFRGINTEVNFEFPVTALTGLNGAGKSTIGQLALCGYKGLSTSSLKRFYVKDFFPVSPVDPKPITDNASAVYKYQTDNSNSDQELTVSRAVTEWGGYKRQPQKAAIYIGLAFYLPKVERKDLTIYSAKNIVLGDRINVEQGASFVSRILGGSYSDIYFQTVESASRTAELGMASRYGFNYSENNMGFGEGRVVHTIRLLETCPAQALIVLEEPETSLHEFAQYEFTKYLMDVSVRRGHQIIFSTHSSVMIDALPASGRKLLTRDEEGVKVTDRLSSNEVRLALSEGRAGHLIVCVEDLFAQSLIREMIRKYDVSLGMKLKVIPFGDAKSVYNANKILTDASVRSIAVRDADQGEAPADNVFKLPGSLPPEKDIFLDTNAKNHLRACYGFDLDQHLTAYPDTDHHSYSDIIAKATSSSREVIEADCIRAVLDNRPAEWGEELIRKIASFV